MFYFVFCVVVILLTFGLSSFYRRGAVHRLVVTYYMCRGNSTDKTDLISRRYQIMVIGILRTRIVDILVTILSNL